MNDKRAEKNTLGKDLAALYPPRFLSTSLLGEHCKPGNRKPIGRYLVIWPLVERKEAPENLGGDFVSPLADLRQAVILQLVDG
jgi:hypothetical protein